VCENAVVALNLEAWVNEESGKLLEDNKSLFKSENTCKHQVEFEIQILCLKFHK